MTKFKGAVPQKSQAGIPNYNIQKAHKKAKETVNVWPTVEYIKGLDRDNPERLAYEQNGRAGWQKHMDSLDKKETA